MISWKGHFHILDICWDFVIVTQVVGPTVQCPDNLSIEQISHNKPETETDFWKNRKFLEQSILQQICQPQKYWKCRFVDH